MNYLVKTSNASVLPVIRRNEKTGRPMALTVKIGLALHQIINVVRYEKIRLYNSSSVIYYISIYSTFFSLFLGQQESVGDTDFVYAAGN